MALDGILPGPQFLHIPLALQFTQSAAGVAVGLLPLLRAVVFRIKSILFLFQMCWKPPDRLIDHLQTLIMTAQFRQNFQVLQQVSLYCDRVEHIGIDHAIFRTGLILTPDVLISMPIQTVFVLLRVQILQQRQYTVIVLSRAAGDRIKVFPAEKAIQINVLQIPAHAFIILKSPDTCHGCPSPHFLHFTTAPPKTQRQLCKPQIFYHF